MILFVNLLRAAFLPNTLYVEDEEDATERESYGVWPTQFPLPASVLSECVRAIRCLTVFTFLCSENFEKFLVPVMYNQSGR